MRHLNKKQRNILDNWFKKNYTGAGSIVDIRQLPMEVFEQVELINDFETLWDHVNNHIGELSSKYVHWKKGMPW